MMIDTVYTGTVQGSWENHFELLRVSGVAFGWLSRVCKKMVMWQEMKKGKALRVN